ncbi:MAG: AEC family transporter [Spirochaetales bacterium]|nr:AEC family transporter [Spirochaetales bacterium]
MPIFFLIATGYVLAKKFEINVNTLSKLNFYAFLPAFTFVTIYTNDLSAYIGKAVLFLFISMAVNSIFVFITAGVRKIDNKKKYALMNSVILFNSGNIGIPLITLVFSGTKWLDEAIVIQITVMLVQSLVTNSLGFYNAGRGSLKWQEAVLSVVKMPTIWAILAAILLKHFSFRLETTFIWPAFIYLRNALIGFVLVTLGVQLSSTKLNNFDLDVLISVIFRLIAAPAASFIILKTLHFEGVLPQVLFISSALPSAVNSALMAIEMDNEPEFAAKSVAFSTIFCSVSLIIVIYLSKILFPL